MYEIDQIDLNLNDSQQTLITVKPKSYVADKRG
jgi:hypothetical protein